MKQFDDKVNGEGVVLSLENKRRIDTLRSSWILKGAFFALCAVCAVLCLIVVWQLARPKNEIAYVVEVNTTTGEQRVISGAVSEIGRYTMSEYLILNCIKTYITNLRSVSNDSGVNRKHISDVFAYSTEQATLFVNEWINNNNPIDRSTNEYVEVVIYNCTPINNTKSNYLKFLVDWNEIVRNTNGKIVSEKNYRADIDAKQYKVTKLTSEVNPVGIYVCHINISEIKDGYVIKSNF